ncbi:RNA-binding cell elongation regulator Jag/EloR [Bellilinea sp.]|uniref:RNA-binding cell elongation regulator Jag/EloR n=1 Tax=Bellilinea sp. TaxID=2838785 RepID=UPI002ADE0B87|nr:RNA-binding cell elongation regulator Jag/EloR [Bellilinea sp.]
MNHEKTTLEIIAPTVEEAVAKGLTQLGLREEEVEVEVLDAGSRGFLGLGSRQARVRLWIREKEGIQNSTTLENEQKRALQIEKKRTSSSATPQSTPMEADSQEKFILQTAEQITGELLQKMHLKARLRATMLPPEDENDQPTVMVEVQGEDLSILIGRRSETLNALQYITSLILSKEVGKWVPLIIDVQGYRARRERQLKVLARRSAEQVVHTGRKITLEPMPANERRVIHLELRDHPDVTTESVGEEPNRKVTIFLKKHHS